MSTTVTDREKLKGLLEFLNGKDEIYEKGNSLIVCNKEKWMFDEEGNLSNIVDINRSK